MSLKGECVLAETENVKSNIAGFVMANKTCPFYSLYFNQQFFLVSL